MRRKETETQHPYEGSTNRFSDLRILTRDTGSGSEVLTGLILRKFALLGNRTRVGRIATIVP